MEGYKDNYPQKNRIFRSNIVVSSIWA